MNNSQLLMGLLCVTLSGGYMSASDYQSRVYSLEEIFEIAENHSIQLRPSLTSAEEAEQEIKIAKSSRLPQINADLSLSYIGNGFTTDRAFADYQKAPIPHLGNGLNLKVEQPLYTGGAISNSIKLAELKSQAAGYSLDLTRENLRYRLTGLYLDLYKAFNQKEVIEKNILQARKVLEDMNSRFQQGMALQNDITRYELLLSNLELQKTRLVNSIDILNRNLVVTAGLPSEITVAPDSSLLDRTLENLSETNWIEEANLHSPEVRLAQTELEINRKAENLVKSERLPKIGLRAEWNLEGPILVEVPPINRNLGYWYVGLGVSYDLSSLYKTNRQLSKSKLSTRKAIEKLEATRENLELEIREAYIRYLESIEEMKTRQKSLELAEKNYRITTTRYNADMALITDLLDASNSKLEAEQMLVNTRINTIFQYYTLLYTSGRI